jgi:hypothetical protein
LSGGSVAIHLARNLPVSPEGAGARAARLLVMVGPRREPWGDVDRQMLKVWTRSIFLRDGYVARERRSMNMSLAASWTAIACLTHSGDGYLRTVCEDLCHALDTEGPGDDAP